MKFPGLRWATFSLVFFGIPLFLVWLAFGNLWREAEEKDRRQLEERLERITSSFDQFRSPDVFVERLFNILVTRVFRSGRDSMRSFEIYRRHLHRRFPGLFTFTFIDGRGEPRPELSDRQPPLAVLRRFASAVKAHAIGENARPLKDQWRLFQGFLGGMLRPDQLRYGALKVAANTDERHFVIISRWHAGGMLVAHVNRIPTWESIAVKDRATFFNRHSRSARAYVIDEMSDWRKRDARRRADIDTMERLLTEFRVTPRMHLRLGGSLWGHAVIGPSVRLLVSMPEAESRERTVEQRLLSFFLVALFFALSVPTWMVMSGKWLPYISIRQKLVGLFLYMVGLPLAFMSLVASDYLGEKRIVLEKQVHDEMEKSLRLFDRGMPVTIGELDRLVKQVIGRPLPTDVPFDRTLADRMAKFRSLTGLDVGVAVDENGDIGYTDGRVDYDDERNRKLLRPIYLNLFRQYNHGPDVDDVKDSPLYKIGSAGGIDVDALYADIVSSLGRITQFNFTGRRTVQIILPLYDVAGKVRFLLSAGWGRNKIENMYLYKYMIPTFRKLDDTRWVAVNRDDPSVFVPRGIRIPSEVDAFGSRLRGCAQALRDSFQIKGHRYLLTGVPGQELSSFDLIAVTSDRFIRTEIGRLQWAVGIVSLAILLTGATVGTLLARKFLEPIGNLAEGVASLRRREFEKRLPILDRDELGDLSQTFNEMMEGMADLEVARIVQESLFPKKSLSLPPFGVCGSCVPATQTGGDYYDFFPMPDGRLMVLIGDVSGHGVGAAMVMAMAKSLVAHMVSQSADPAVILASINTTLLKVLERQRIMSCFMGFLDGEKKRMAFSNAGHNDPFVVRGKTVIQIQGERAFPLGASKRNRLAPTEFAFEAGDRLVLYTDGLIEAVAIDGEPVNYDRFIDALPGLMRDDAESTERAIREWHGRIVKPGPQADDITVVIVTVGGPVRS
ncbi:MAG TPA: SpoIIE family protein phosphatase [Candidatus Ozemobacteraceae bacterium]|nr:SpoIIE family protein phosphatase [Candidatus Ozemobacteraceae bacterium]